MFTIACAPNTNEKEEPKEISLPVINEAPIRINALIDQVVTKDDLNGIFSVKGELDFIENYLSFNEPGIYEVQWMFNPIEKNSICHL